MSHHVLPPSVPNSLSIGLVAYSATPAMVFVRVPNERGRWMLTDRCVVEVPCDHCKATVGEPCRRLYDHGMKYHVGTHWMRRRDARIKNGGNFVAGQPYPKLRLRPEDLAAPYVEPGDNNDQDHADPS